MRLTVETNALNPRYERLMRIWGQVQHELLYVCWALADVALLTPFALGVMGWAQYWQPGVVLLWLLVLMLFAFNLTRLMSALHLPPRHQQTITAMTLFLVIVVTLPIIFHAGSPIFRFGWVGDIFTAVNEPNNNLWLRDVILFVLLVLVWVRGLQLGRRDYSVERAGLRLRVGGLILAPIVVWLANTRLLWDSTSYILLFFLAGLIALALIRAQEIEKSQWGTAVALHPRWVTAVFLASLLTIFTAGTAAVIISGESANRLIGWLAPISDSLRLTGLVALITLVYLLVPLLSLIEWLTNVIGRLLTAISPALAEWWAYLGKVVGKFFINQRIPLLPDGGNNLANEPIVIEEVEQLTIQIDRSGQAIILLLAVALILLVALLVSRLYRETAVVTRTTQRLDPHTRDEDEDGNLLQKVLGRLGLWRNWQTAVSIRRIYRNMLRAADASGYPRLETETPFEFLKTLARAWPEHQQQTHLITNAYVKVRYGELPETKEELQAIKDAWRTLEQAPPIDPIEQTDDSNGRSGGNQTNA
ncbi:DUF4129 domain-containing protein [Candidatus Leptofilum sp.]|uniref:DUF4129 domain-containing protein n=1 Tax=Candidatus Leptofilum sp. TaxID=3241576 RepID=UPI003B5BCAAA